MNFLFRFSMTVLRVGAVLLLGALLLSSSLPFFPAALSSLPRVSYTKEGWMQGELAVLGHPIPVDLRDAADLLSRFRREGEPDAIENALRKAAADIANAFFSAFGTGSEYRPDNAVLA